MGTRSVTRFIEKVKEKDGVTKEVVLVAIYQQYDGYPSHVGMQIAEFLNGIELVNGISGETELGIVDNGVVCLSELFIKQIKDRVGGVYITSPEDQQQYNYDIIIGYEGEGWDEKPMRPVIRVDVYDGTEEDGDRYTFQGSPKQFISGVKNNKIA